MLVGLAAAMAVAYFPLFADDAYIVARYAEQLHAGRGPAYNPGEAVNALTSPFHFGTLVALRSFTADSVTIYRALSAALVAAVLVSIARLRWGRNWRGAFFLALTLACPFVAFWTVGGLETPLLLLVCTVIACMATTDDARSAAWIVGLAALAVLIRYDAVLFVAPLALRALWQHHRDFRVKLSLAAGAFVVLAWIAFTLAYYGDILPTSFYVKAGRAPMPSELTRGLLYVASFLTLTWLWVALLLPRVSASPPKPALWIGLGLTFAYALFASTKHMMYGYRLLVPFLPALVLALLDQGRVAPARGRQALLAGVLVAQAGLAAFVYFMSQNPSLSLIDEGRAEANERFEFSHFGARYTRTFLDTAQGQSEAIRKHWSGTGLSSVRAPRLLVSTGGLLPYLMPEAYVFEQLVSYRHDCKAALEPLADYVQAIFPSDQSARFAEERMRLGRESIARFTFDADGLRNEPQTIVVEVWYRASDAPNSLPPKLRGACQ